MCCDYDKRTPLHLAAAEGAFSCVEWLLEQGASPNPVDRFQRTPLEEAVRGDHGEVANLLIKAGAQVVDSQGQLVELSGTRMAGNVRMYGEEFNPEWELDPNDLLMMDKLGEGEFGVVHKARWHGTIVAVKILKGENEVALGDFRTELNVLQKVHHPHCVQFLGGCTKSKPYMIVTELMSGGSMSDIFRGPERITMRRGVEMALDCARGMAYLHSRRNQQVIHRDLKPANLMLGGHVQEGISDQRKLIHTTGVVKIADFGLSKSLITSKPQGANGAPGGTGGMRGELYKLTGETGSYRYMAPEVFRHEPYNFKVDVYAFSMICYQLFEGIAPYFAMNPVEAARMAAMQQVRPQWGINPDGTKVPPDLQRLVEACWHPNYGQRPTFPDIVLELEAVLARMPMPVSVSASRACGACALM